MVNLPNQRTMPAPGAAGTFSPLSPQPKPAPYSKGDPPEGPQTFLAFLNIPAGSLTANLSLDISQFGMSMVQSLLIDNEANPVAITVQSQGGPGGVKFGIPAFGTQIVPMFQRGTQLLLAVTLGAVQLVQTQIAFQVFNAWVPPASWVSSLAVSGNVNVAAVSGSVNVQVGNAAFIGLTLAASISGGAKGTIFTALTNAVVQVKPAPGQATLKGAVGNAGATAAFLQFFDAAAPGSVTLGATLPTYVFPVAANSQGLAGFPPEGLTIFAGLQVAWTTTPTGAAAPAANWQGTILYF